MSDYTEIYIDGKFAMTVANMFDVRHEIRTWAMKTPFWEQTKMLVRCYRNAEKNPDFKNRNDPTIESNEKNLFFMKDDNPYICLRCGRPSEIVGFCGTCYSEVYAMENIDETEIPLEDVKCSEKFYKVVEADPEYTQKIKESILKDGMKNPIILDSDKRILIGHHRYYIAKELGWDTIRCKINDIDFNHGLFYEGKGSDIFIAKMDGKLCMSTTDVDSITPLILDFYMKNLGDTLIMECYINAGSDIRLRNVFIPERGDVVDPTWHDWYIRKFNKKPKIGRFS